MTSSRSDGTKPASRDFKLYKESSISIKEFAERIGAAFQYGEKEPLPAQSDSDFLETLPTLKKALGELGSCTNWTQFRVVRDAIRSNVDSWKQSTLGGSVRKAALRSLREVCLADEEYRSLTFDTGVDHAGHVFHGYPDEELRRRPVYVRRDICPDTWLPQTTKQSGDAD